MIEEGRQRERESAIRCLASDVTNEVLKELQKKKKKGKGFVAASPSSSSVVNSSPALLKSHSGCDNNTPMLLD